MQYEQPRPSNPAQREKVGHLRATPSIHPEMLAPGMVDGTVGGAGLGQPAG